MNLDFEKKTLTIEDSVNKLKFEHKMTLADKENRIKELEESRKNALRRAKESEAGREKLERQFDEYRTKHSDERLFQLRSQIEIARSEKGLLERELEIKNRSLEDCLKSNAALKQKIKVLTTRGQVIDVTGQQSTPGPKNNDDISKVGDAGNKAIFDNLVSSTVKLDHSNVDLVQELDQQIQQVLSDLDR